MTSRLLLATFVCLVAASMIFLIWPNIDPWFSGLFWNGQSFLLQKTGWGKIFTVYLHSGMRVAFVMFAVSGWFFLPARHCLFIILSVALAAGLMTNVVFKDHWGRARPLQVTEFGGTANFTPAWIMTDQCQRNCSFIGGDASFAFCALAPALLAKRRRKVWISTAVGFGVIISLGRIAAGAHFLSDCVIAGLMTLLIVYSLNMWLSTNEPNEP